MGCRISVTVWEVLNGVGVDGVGVVFPFFTQFSFFMHFFAFCSFSSFFFAFLFVSQRTMANNGKFYCKKRGISLRPRLHRPQNFPNSAVAGPEVWRDNVLNLASKCEWPPFRYPPCKPAVLGSNAGKPQLEIMAKPCPSFPCFFGKWPRQPPKNQGFLMPTEPLKSLEKKGKTLKKTRNSHKRKKQGIPKKTRKGRTWKRCKSQRSLSQVVWGVGQRGLAQGNTSHTINSRLFFCPLFPMPPYE